MLVFSYIVLSQRIYYIIINTRLFLGNNVPLRKLSNDNVQHILRVRMQRP